MRPLCTCGQRPAAINYKKNNKTTIVTMRNLLRNGKDTVYRWETTWL